MSTDRISYRVEDRVLGRTHEGTGAAGVLIVDDVLISAAGQTQAFDLLVAGAESLKIQLPKGSQRSAAAHQFSAYGRQAINGDRTVHGPHRAVMTATAMLDVVKEVLGPDAAEQVRRAAAERMGCG